MKRRSRYTPVTNGCLGLAPEVLPSTSTPPGVVASLASPADILVGVLDLPFVSAAVVDEGAGSLLFFDTAGLRENPLQGVESC